MLRLSLMEIASTGCSHRTACTILNPIDERTEWARPSRLCQPSLANLLESKVNGVISLVIHEPMHSGERLVLLEHLLPKSAMFWANWFIRSIEQEQND
jgi:hypothetical protein